MQAKFEAAFQAILALMATQMNFDPKAYRFEPVIRGIQFKSPYVRLAVLVTPVHNPPAAITVELL